MVVGKEQRHVHDQVADDREARQGPQHDGVVSPSSDCRQARPLRPLMFIASEPQIPSRHERRNDSEVVDALEADQHIEQLLVAGLGCDVVVLHARLRIGVGG